MLVETQQLTKRYGPVEALAGCTMSVHAGEVFGLLGPNGAGKTTLLRLLMGYLQPTSGAAFVDKLDCYRQSVAVHRLVSYLPADVRLFRSMRGRDVLKFFAGVRPRGNKQRAYAVAERLGLDISRRVGYMSTGMRQKLALAIALSADVPLIVLDEPTNGLDPSVRGEVIRMVAEAQREERTVVFSSHVLSEVEEVCDRVAILRSGRLVHMQEMSQLRRRHRVFVKSADDLPAPPEAFAGEVHIRRRQDGITEIETPGELSPLLGWLAGISLREVRVEPVGLRAVYDRFHADSLSSDSLDEEGDNASLKVADGTQDEDAA